MDLWPQKHAFLFNPVGGGGGALQPIAIWGVPLYRVDFERQVSLK